MGAGNKTQNAAKLAKKAAKAEAAIAAMAAKVAKADKRNKPVAPEPQAKRKKTQRTDTQGSSSSSQPSLETVTAGAASELEHWSGPSAEAGRGALAERRNQDILSVHEVSSDDGEPIRVSPNDPTDVEANETARSTWKAGY
jgi:hypothetical protein